MTGTTERSFRPTNFVLSTSIVLIAWFTSVCFAAHPIANNHALHRIIKPSDGTQAHSVRNLIDKVLAREIEWEPELSRCAVQCSVLEQAFSVCKVSECLCTDVVALGYRQCMACSINLAQEPGLLSDAQANMNGFIEQCRSDGFDINPQTVSVGDATLAVPSFTPFTGTVNEFSNFPSPTVTAFPSGSVIIISGGGSFGGTISFGATVTAGTNNGGESVSAVTVSERVTASSSANILSNLPSSPTVSVTFPTGTGNTAVASSNTTPSGAMGIHVVTSRYLLGLLTALAIIAL
ncbi:hypothetical protein BDY19DRAFT_376682 [Irpex rosettiformis]|uniref:Uncharacterized protein n=1 Tax=Irpex rosettiformis TaxID=378272 RepID=A0ACB8TVU3_9APHY|nr:hypothetical protein BDY19DRAFT_376682 [Irpex rosettiformis]